MSDPNPYQYSLTEDPNDPRALQKSLKRLSFQNPESFGGHYYRRPPIAQFATHVPPDITSNTHVFGVLGIEQKQAMPWKDGWFLSDFFAFWHLLQGTTTKKQTWLHALDLDKLINEHKEYLHGNPYKNRKVVLNRAILNKAQDKASKDSITKIENARNLKMQFRNQFVSVCKTAAAANENVILLVFAHGDLRNNGIYLGEGSSDISKVFTFKRLVRELRDTKVKVCLISTACYSGGWCCQPDLQLTGFTATGSREEHKSLSWAKSGSSGRYCGSVFAANIAGCLIKGWLSEDVDDDDSLTEVQGMSLAALDSTVHRSLLEMHDRRGYEHCMSFSAQDDTWSMHWQQRTGLPLSNFAQRWNDLPDYPKDPTLHPGDPLNRDPTVSQEVRNEFQRLEQAHRASGGGPTHLPSSQAGASQSLGSQNILGKRKFSSLYGGSVEAMRSQVFTIGDQYMQSNKLMDAAAKNHALHSLLSDIFSGKNDNPQDFESALIQLEYRMSVMSTADRYLELMEVPYPNGQQCYEYDEMDSYKWTSPDDGEISEMLRERADVLFPRPVEEQGLWFGKGVTYLAKAFVIAGLSKAVIQQKLDALVVIIQRDIEEQLRIVKEVPEVKTKRQKLWQVLGKVGNMSPVKSRSRSTSPTKRRSRGQSLGQKENVGSSSHGH